MPTDESAVRIAVGPHALAGTVVAPRRQMPGVLFIHGWGGSQLQYLTRARQVASLGCVCLTFDLSGHVATRSQWTTVSRDQNLRDVLAAYDVLAARPEVDRDAIAVVGSSYGGYLGAILTRDRPVRWLAMRAPALYYDDGWSLPKLQLHRDFDLVGYRRRRIAVAENRALRACAAFRGDVLLVESEHDEIVPAPVLQSYREACADAHTLGHERLLGADHGLTAPEHQETYTRLLVSWFGERLSTARAAVAPAPPAVTAAPEVAPTTG